MIGMLVFDLELDAIAAIVRINRIMNMPISGRRVSGTSSPGQGTVRWAVPEMRRDGKWFFALPPIPIPPEWEPLIQVITLRQLAGWHPAPVIE